MPQAFLKLPSWSYLHECLIYKPTLGTFIWRRRPISHFPDEHAWRICNTQRAGKLAGTLTKKGYRIIQIDGKQYRAARIASKMVTGEDPPELVDHRNLNRADDRWSNLRTATASQNRMNSGTNIDNVVGLKGVYRMGKRWHARITVNGIKHFLGAFTSPEAAHHAYQRAARCRHGEFARFR